MTGTASAGGGDGADSGDSVDILARAEVDARGMRCPWPVLRAAKAMRNHHAILIRADDPRSAGELQALAEERGWVFAVRGDDIFALSREINGACP